VRDRYYVVADTGDGAQYLCRTKAGEWFWSRTVAEAKFFGDHGHAENEAFLAVVRHPKLVGAVYVFQRPSYRERVRIYKRKEEERVRQLAANAKTMRFRK
jgi:hypothetical protein